MPTATETCELTSRSYILDLAQPDKRMKVTETVNAGTGEIRYQFIAPRAAGTVTMSADLPWSDTEDLLSTHVHIQLGAGSSYTRDVDREDRPVVHGVPLIGGVYLEPAEFLARAKPDLHWRRPTDRYSTISAPTATSRYFTEIITVLLTVWHQRPDRDALVLARARHLAPSRIAETKRSLAALHARATEIAAQVHAQQQWVAKLTALISPPQGAETS